MPGIIDEFVVSLGLDPKKYNEQVSKFRQDQKRLQEETRRNTREMEADTHRAIEGFANLRNEVVGLFLVLAGGRSFGTLVEDMIHGAATTGRFAANIGLATEEVSAWEGAVRTAGGTAEEARAALAALNAEFTSFSLTGRATHDADLAALGIGMNTLRDPSELAMALAERSEHMSRREFAARMSRIGIPESVINTLARGRRGLQELIDEQYRLGVVTQRDTEAAQAFEAQWANLTTHLRGELRPVLTWLVEQALPYMEQHTPIITTGVYALAAAFAVMALRVAGLPGVLAAIYANLYRIVNVHGGVGGTLSGLLYAFRGIHIAALHRDLDAFDAAHPNYNSDPALSAQRGAILQQISDAEDQRQADLAGSSYVDPSAAPMGTPGAASGGHWWQLGGSGAPGGDLARVRATESGGDYNATVYHLLRRNLTGMSIGAVTDFQPSLTAASRPISLARGLRNGSSGVGAYQFERATLISMAQRVFGPNWRSVMFTPENQDRMAQALHGISGNSAWAIGGVEGRARGGARLAAGRGGGGGTAVSVGSIVVYTPPGTTGAQAAHVARAIPGAIRRRGVVTQANSGLQ